MGYSPAAQAGIKVHGRGWRKTIRGLPGMIDHVHQALEADDSEAVDAALREIGKLFRPHIAEDSEDATPGEMEAVEWFEEESCAYELEHGEKEEFAEEFNYRLGELYDWADYNRVWLDPSR